MTTGDSAVEIKNKNWELLNTDRPSLEVYYKSYDYGVPFIKNSVDYVQSHFDYKPGDAGVTKEFSKYNFEFIFVSTLTHRKIFSWFKKKFYGCIFLNA